MKALTGKQLEGTLMGKFLVLMFHERLSEWGISELRCLMVSLERCVMLDMFLT